MSKESQGLVAMLKKLTYDHNLIRIFKIHKASSRFLKQRVNEPNYLFSLKYFPSLPYSRLNERNEAKPTGN